MKINMTNRIKEVAFTTFLMLLSPAALAYLVLVCMDMLQEDDPLGLLAMFPND